MSPENPLSKLKFTLIVSHCRLFFESVFRIETFWHCLFLQFLILAVQPDFPKCRHAAINRITGNRGYFPEQIFGIGKLVTCINTVVRAKRQYTENQKSSVKSVKLGF